MNETAPLTEDELRDAAAEAGISPAELRQALARREGEGLPARREPATIAATNVTMSAMEGRVPLPPADANEAVRLVIERRTGRRGHRQGGGRVDIVDDEQGVVFKVQSEADGAGGALVRVDVEAMSGNFALASLMVGALSLGLISLGYLLSTMVLLLGVLVGGIGAFAVLGSRRKVEQARARGRAIAGEALLEAEEAPPPPGTRALPPMGRQEP